MSRPSRSRQLRATAPSIERLEPRQLLSGGGAPNGPYVLTAAAPTVAAVQLSFYDSADNETNFIIERSANGGSFAPIATLDPQAGVHGQILYTDSAVAAGTSYAYRAYAINGIYQSSIVGPVSVTAPGAPTEPARVIPYSVPDGPYALAVNANPSASFDLTFYDSATNEAGFVVERSDSPDGPFTALATLAPSPGRSALITYTDATANASNTYYYRVYAFNGIYQSSINGPVSPSSIRLANLGNAALTVGGGIQQYSGGTLQLATINQQTINSNLLVNSGNLATLNLTNNNQSGVINVTGGTSAAQTQFFNGILNLGSSSQFTKINNGSIQPIGPQTINTSNLTLNTSQTTLNNATLQLGTFGQVTSINNGAILLNNNSQGFVTKAGTFSLNGSLLTGIQPGPGSLLTQGAIVSNGSTLTFQTAPSGPFTITNPSDVPSFVKLNGTTYTVAPQGSLVLNGATNIDDGTSTLILPAPANSDAQTT